MAKYNYQIDDVTFGLNTSNVVTGFFASGGEYDGECTAYDVLHFVDFYNMNNGQHIGSRNEPYEAGRGLLFNNFTQNVGYVTMVPFFLNNLKLIANVFDKKDNKSTRIRYPVASVGLSYDNANRQVEIRYATISGKQTVQFAQNDGKKFHFMLIRSGNGPDMYLQSNGSFDQTRYEFEFDLNQFCIGNKGRSFAYSHVEAGGYFYKFTLECWTTIDYVDSMHTICAFNFNEYNQGKAIVINQDNNMYNGKYFNIFGHAAHLPLVGSPT